MSGLSKTRLYSIFSGMKSRCYNAKDKHYKWYGGKGITICDEWLGDNGVQIFIEWALNNGYNENLSIDRIDSNGTYCPENCRWISSSLNSSYAHLKNNDNSKMSLTMGEKIKVILKRRNMTVAQLAEKIGQSRQNFSNKLSRDNFTEKELYVIADAMNCSFKATFITNDTNEEI